MSGHFSKANNGTASAMAFRLTGSPNIFEREEREAVRSIDFVTCHDGFTLNDLVSFNSKHNEANGESNRDGGGAKSQLELRYRRSERLP
jgi:isoamylase